MQWIQYIEVGVQTFQWDAVRLKAPHWSGYSSVVRRDWIQLIGRKLAHTTAGKGRARRMPQEKGIPRRIELRQRIIKTSIIQDNLSVAPKTIIQWLILYCVCRNFQQNLISLRSLRCFILVRKFLGTCRASPKHASVAFLDLCEAANAIIEF
jgi:hypothetical protein